MNNRANIAFNLLPIVALVLCGISLFAFITLDDKFEEKSQEIARLSSDLNVMRQYIESSAKLISEDLARKGVTRESVQESARNRDLHLRGQGNFFSRIEEGNFEVTQNGDSITLKIRGIYIQSRQGNSFAQSNFDLIIETNNQGRFIRFINK